jgi:hypothetical protein
MGAAIRMMIEHDELFVPFPVPRLQVPEATHFRSTWLSSSVSALRDRGYYDRYVTLLPEVHRAMILETVAGVWLPIEVCLAHYGACDALALSRRDAWDIGVEVTRKVHGTTLALAIRLAKQAGVTPWTILAQLPRLWERVWRGGGVAVHKAGPKEAIVEVIRWKPAGIAYVRHTMPAVVQGIVELFCTKVYTTEVVKMTSPSSLGLRLQWA